MWRIHFNETTWCGHAVGRSSVIAMFVSECPWKGSGDAIVVEEDSHEVVEWSLKGTHGQSPRMSFHPCDIIITRDSSPSKTPRDSICAFTRNAFT